MALVLFLQQCCYDILQGERHVPYEPFSSWAHVPLTFFLLLEISELQ